MIRRDILKNVLMNDIVGFLRECGVFYLLTINGGSPAGRPFGAIMEYENCLYIATADTKSVYSQLKENENIQILALKQGTRDWLRISGIASECYDLDIKQRMLNECPVLSKHYESAKVEHYNIFKIRVISSEFN